MFGTSPSRYRTVSVWSLLRTSAHGFTVVGCGKHCLNVSPCFGSAAHPVRSSKLATSTFRILILSYCFARNPNRPVVPCYGLLASAIRLVLPLTLVPGLDLLVIPNTVPTTVVPRWHATHRVAVITVVPVPVRLDFHRDQHKQCR